MELLRRIKHFTKSTTDKLQIYKTFIRNNLEQSCAVWESSITKQINSFLIRNDKHPYKEALELLNIPTLKERRTILSARFAEKCLENKKTKNMFPIIKKIHNMNTRNQRKFQETNARTVRMAMSSIPTMRKHLNKKHQELQSILNSDSS